MSDNYKIERQAYRAAKDRCENINNAAYRNYGGRGIKFGFQSFEDFIAEVGAKTNIRHSLNRIDNNGNYEKGNVEWASGITQARNTRRNVKWTIDGETKCLAEWAELYNISVVRIDNRVRYQDWCQSCAVKLPNYGVCVHRAEKDRLPKMNCPRLDCSHEWTPKISNPKQCPRCKQYLPIGKPLTETFPNGIASDTNGQAEVLTELEDWVGLRKRER